MFLSQQKYKHFSLCAALNAGTIQLLISAKVPLQKLHDEYERASSAELAKLIIESSYKLRPTLLTFLPSRHAPGKMHTANI